MTAPKQIWVNECDYTQCTPHEAITGIRYIRADAPELLALVETVKKIRESWKNESQFGLLPVYHRMSAQLLRDDAAKALSAYEAMK